MKGRWIGSAFLLGIFMLRIITKQVKRLLIYSRLFVNFYPWGKAKGEILVECFKVSRFTDE